MKRNYVSTDLTSFINESKNQKNNDTKLNEGCNCGKNRPSRPTEQPKRTELPKQSVKEVGMSKSRIPTIKKGVMPNGKINESATITDRIKKMANEIKNHKFNSILESKCKDSTKIALMVNEGVSKETATLVLEGFHKRVDFIQKGFAKLDKLNEGFEMVDDEMDNCEDYDFKDRRHGQLETGLYDSAPDSLELDEEGFDLNTASITEDGFDEEDDDILFDEEEGIEDDLGDELGDEESDDLESVDMGGDESLGNEEDLDQVGEEVEIKKFVFGVDNVQGAIEELSNLGIDAQEFSDNEEGSDDFGGDEFGDTEVSDETELEGDEFGSEDESFDDSEDILSEGAKSKNTSKIYEGEIIIDVENWGDDEYDAFTQWLESYDIDPEEIFGEEGEIEVSDVEEEDFTDETSTDDLGGEEESFGVEEETFDGEDDSFGDYEEEEIQ